MTAAEFWAYIMPSGNSAGDDLVILRATLLMMLSAAGVADAIWSKVI